MENLEAELALLLDKYRVSEATLTPNDIVARVMMASLEAFQEGVQASHYEVQISEGVNEWSALAIEESILCDNKDN